MQDEVVGDCRCLVRVCMAKVPGGGPRRVIRGVNGHHDICRCPVGACCLDRDIRLRGDVAEISCSGVEVLRQLPRLALAHAVVGNKGGRHAVDVVALEDGHCMARVATSQQGLSPERMHTRIETHFRAVAPKESLSWQQHSCCMACGCRSREWGRMRSLGMGWMRVTSGATLAQVDGLLENGKEALLVGLVNCGKRAKTGGIFWVYHCPNSPVVGT